MVNNNIKSGLTTLFLGSVGDIASRSMWLNCSVDKPWTMFFFLPPLSIVSAVMHFMNKIEKGSQSCMSAIDFTFFMIPILTILFAFTIPMIIGEPGFLSNFLVMLSVFILFAIVRMYRSNKMCKVHFMDKNKGFNLNHVKRALLISLVVNGVIAIFNAFSPFGRKIPVIGVGFRIWGYLRIIPGLQHALPLTLIHFLINLHDNVPKNLENVCIKES
jgi:hypothetical protein